LQAKVAMQHKMIGARRPTHIAGSMSVHVIADSLDKLADLRAKLGPQFRVTFASLQDRNQADGEFDAVIVAADLRIIANIAPLKEVSQAIRSAPKRIFLIDQRARLSTAQAYALGATRVLLHPVSELDLFTQLSGGTASEIVRAGPSDIQATASTSAVALGAMFSAVLQGKPVDVAATQNAAARIADSVASDGLSDWLETVRRHHMGTYQHCLLVTGIAVDFGLSLGVRKADVQRLYSAAMFHDIGKAVIPVAVLDKPGRLDPDERALIETHPAAGYEILKGTAGISQEVLDCVRHHHEYLDGSGYPDALSASSISDLVRILTISDIFGALIENRGYEAAMPRDKAYEILRSMHGKLEMPLVAAFKDVALNR
jgi:putative nucleotidyltransferase with HDIG domain